MKDKILKKIINHWDLILVGIFAAVYIAIFSSLSILRHQAFASNFDLANMSQTVWNTLHGRPFALSAAEGTVSRFSIHADLILILLSPLYLIYERSITLLVAQSFFLGIGAFPVYLLSRKILENESTRDSSDGRPKDKKYVIFYKILSLVLVLVYLLNPSMQWTNIYDFHGVALAIPFLLLTFYFAYTRRWKSFWVFVFLSLITKEEISLLIASIGIVLFFVFKEKVRGALAFCIGITWFLLMIFVVMPYFSSNNEVWSVKSLYTPVIQKVSVSDTPAKLADVFRGYFLTPVAFNYYTALLKPFAFVPILGLPWLLLATPEFAVNLLSTNAQMQALTFHYHSGITPFLVIANIFGLKYLFAVIFRYPVIVKYKKWVLLLVAFLILYVALRVNYHHSPLPTTPSCWCILYRVTKDDIEFDKVLKQIPEDASVTSSGEIRPHISRREHSYTLPGNIDNVEYVAILDETRIIGDYSPKEFENALLKDPKFLETHDLVTHMGHFYLFKKKSL